MKRKPLQLKLPTSYELILSPQGDRMAAIGKINVVTVDTVKMQRLMFCHPFSHPAHACFFKLLEAVQSAQKIRAKYKQLARRWTTSISQTAQTKVFSSPEAMSY